MTASPDIVCLGEPMAEFCREGGAESLTYRLGVGGDTSNAAIAAARQGASVGYVTALGQDRFGDRIVQLWADEGVDASAVVRSSNAPTGLYIIDPDPAERHFTYFRVGSAASRFSEADLPRDYLASASVLHVTGITLAVSEHLREAALAAMDLVRASGGDVSYDTNLRLKLWDLATARSQTERAARRATVLVTSIEDAEDLFALSDPSEICAHVAALGPRIVVVTRGAEGALLCVDGQIGEIAPARADPVDSTGAGDSFTGAFLAWWRETGDPWLAAGRAAIVAAGTVSGLGAIEPIPRRDAVLAREMSSVG
ncbi:MAG: sugar kinase [Pseudomonadota bacterium]